MACRIGALLVNSDSYCFPRLKIAGNRGVFNVVSTQNNNNNVTAVCHRRNYNDSIIKILF